MGDYLGNLAQRIVSAPAIRPRTRSLFEPDRISSALVLPEMEQRVTVTEIPAPQPVHAAIQKTVPRVEEPASAPRNAKGTSPAIDHVVLGTRRETAPLESKAVERAEAAEPREQPAATPLPRPTPAPHVVPDAHVNLSARETSVERLERKTRVESREIVRTVHVPKQEEPVPTTPAVPVPYTPAANEQQAIFGVQPARATDAGRPDIHISIGRVIVNAAAAAAPSKPAPTPAAPVVRVSLEQYLRQRGGRT
jgi:hypothetical protein